MATRLGLTLPQMKQYDLGRDVPDVARAAEAIGYDSLWVFERALFPDPRPRAVRHRGTGLAGLVPRCRRTPGDPDPRGRGHRARRARHQRPGRPAARPLPARQALATLDAASGGRVVAGLGTGWSLDEYAAASARPFAERGQVLDEVIDGVPRGVGPRPGGLRRPPHQDRVGRRRPEARPADPDPAPRQQREGTPRPSTTRRRLDADRHGRRPTGRAVASVAGPGRRARPHRPLRDGAADEPTYTAKPYAGDDRQAFQGGVEPDRGGPVPTPSRPRRDLPRSPDAPRDAEELKDVAAEVYEAARAAGRPPRRAPLSRLVSSRGGLSPRAVPPARSRRRRRPGPGLVGSVVPPNWCMTPQTAFSAVWTAPSAQPAVQEMSSPARKMPRLSAGRRSCMKWVNRRRW